jgi:hypothetical protein
VTPISLGGAHHHPASAPFAFCKSKTLHLLNNFSSPLLPALDNHHSTYCLYVVDYPTCLM